MKLKYIISFALLFVLSLTGCGYLDIVPTESANEQDAFKDREAARRYLYSCYSYLPNPRHQTESIDFFTADEVVTAFEHETFANFPKGNYTPSNPVISYWNTLFQGIRQCYLLLNNIDSVPMMDDSDKQEYKAEATFLIAYYHYLLVKCYGPTIIVDRVYPLDTPIDEYPIRSPYDECVSWVADKFDEAVALGLPNEQEETSYGRATRPAALAIKSRMLLYAASPLFNGGKTAYPDSDADDLSGFYANFKDVDGVQLMSSTYDASKWQKAADATLDAINASLDAGIRLYQLGDTPSSISEPSDPTEKTLRMTFVDRYSAEIIWAETRHENHYSIQRKSTPYNEKNGGSFNGLSPTLNMVQSFYTKNGLPIEEDPEYDYGNAFNYSEQTDFSHGVGTTLNLNKDREPRFYAWVAYHNSYYELYAYADDEGVTEDNRNKMLVGFRKNDNCGIQSRTRAYPPSGYLNKKGVHPSFSRATGGSVINYPWPIIRLSELYLNYAEALIELGGGSNLTTAKEYIDQVRERAGIPTVDEAWAQTGAVLDQDKMRKIVRQERTIEFYLENQRFWDVRRWLLGTKYFNTKAKGLDYSQATDAGFFNVVEVNFTRSFRSPQHYLMPIPIGDTQKNPRIAQNPGY
ncbi:RagB/SusD family nutrient uptake outer membrane protein [Sunxiuqinia elliptica]|uniref:Putative outer membrane starch-binding protein n=1 Tax=Sunxiuqinia elliptica TaxID=655355 RepID=A0A4R6GRB6_9BACT|nr:RagB/SusD family nutrient uptake outer membrane protein [Sunxiuqinia elliptica]TDN97124.1 putative outer membrane starch-binding protein [Sunxiuqinia elliptica]TDO60691.1 putative outer membrane starch-binding protein [Sunxiuqinia elliptica]